MESQNADYLDREEQHNAGVEFLKEENIATMKNIVSMTRVLSSRHRIYALANDAFAKAFIDAMGDVQATINNVGEDWDQETKRQILLGAVGSSSRPHLHLPYLSSHHY